MKTCCWGKINGPAARIAVRGRARREHRWREKRALGGWKPHGCIQVALRIFAEVSLTHLGPNNAPVEPVRAWSKYTLHSGTFIKCMSLGVQAWGQSEGDWCQEVYGHIWETDSCWDPEDKFMAGFDLCHWLSLCFSCANKELIFYGVRGIYFSFLAIFHLGRRQTHQGFPLMTFSWGSDHRLIFQTER